MENIKESVHALRNVWIATNRVNCIIALIMQWKSFCGSS